VHLDKRKEALASYNRALHLSADYVPALEGAAEIEFATSDQRAVPLLNRLVKMNPQDETAHAMLAALAYKRDECTIVVQEFQQARVAIASQIQALEEYGYCLVKLKRTAEAIPVFQHLTDLQPQSERARYNLAVVQSASERYQDAIGTLTRSGGARQDDPEALDLLAQNYEITGDTPHAVASLRQAIVENSDVAKYYVDFANICLAHSSFQVGVDMLNAGLERIPQAAALYLARGILYIQLGQYDRSEQDFAEAEKFDPKLEYGAAAEGLAELQQNNLTNAEAVVRERLRRKPNEAFLHYLLAETLLRKGATPRSAEFTEALKAARRAVQLQNNFALGRDVLGRLYLQQGKIEEAIKQSRLAFEQDPTDQTALYHLITALRRGGNAEEIPPLAKKLAALREQAQLKEASEHRYALVEVKPSEAPH
jgi:tetratricopeptide (TPR) repeat protein